MQYAAYVNADERMTVYTVNYPLQYFAQRIAGERADVIFPVPRGIDPAFWNPDAKSVSAYQKSDLILLNGANYAKWVNRVSLPRLRLVNTSRTFAENYIHVESEMTHSHGGGADHAHARVAFTTWLDMQQSIQQAESIQQALIKKRPQFKVEFDNNFENLKSDLLSLDAELKSIVSNNQNQTLLASHSVYQYLARRYGVNLHSVMWEPDVSPNQSQWKQLENLALRHAAKLMIWESKPEAESERLKQMGISSVVFEPLRQCARGR